MTPRDRLLAVLVPTIWGFNFVVIDWGMNSSDGRSVPPLLFAAIRFALAAFPAMLFVPRPQVAWHKVVAVGAFMLLGQFGLLYSAMAVGMPAGLASLVLQAQVPLTIVFAAVALRERPSRAQVSGVSLGVVGLLVVGFGKGGHVPATALLLCLAAGLSWAVGNVISRAAKVPGGLGLTVWSSAVAPLPLLGLSFVVDGPHGVADGLAAFGLRAALSTLYTVGFATILGYAVFNSLLARLPSSSVVPWVLIAPVVGILSAWLCFGEHPNAAELEGGLAIVVGVLVAQGVLRVPSRAAPRVVGEPPVESLEVGT